MSPLRHTSGQVTYAMTLNNKDNSSFSGGKHENLSTLSATRKRAAAGNQGDF